MRWATRGLWFKLIADATRLTSSTGSSPQHLLHSSVTAHKTLPFSYGLKVAKEPILMIVFYRYLNSGYTQTEMGLVLSLACRYLYAQWRTHK
jgi:hypothetical protein